MGSGAKWRTSRLDRPGWLGRIRLAAAIMLAAVFAVLLPAAITAAWARHTILSTSGYVAAVAPVGTDPAVRSAVRTAAVDEIEVVLHHAASALPLPARFLSGLELSLVSRARDAIGRFLASPAFRRLWIAANAGAHSLLIGVLDGTSAVLTATKGEVVLNLGPLVCDVLKEFSGHLTPLAGKAITRLRIPLFPAVVLVRVRRVFWLVNAGTLAVPILTSLTAAAALLTAPRGHRRRTLLLLAIGGSATVAVLTIATALLRSRFIAQQGPRWRPAVSAIAHHLTSGLFTAATWCVIGGLVLAAAALVLGRPALGGRPALRWPAARQFDRS